MSLHHFTFHTWHCFIPAPASSPCTLLLIAHCSQRASTRTRLLSCQGCGPPSLSSAATATAAAPCPPPQPPQPQMLSLFPRRTPPHQSAQLLTSQTPKRGQAQQPPPPPTLQPHIILMPSSPAHVAVSFKRQPHRACTPSCAPSCCECTAWLTKKPTPPHSPPQQIPLLSTPPPPASPLCGRCCCPPQCAHCCAAALCLPPPPCRVCLNQASQGLARPA